MIQRRFKIAATFVCLVLLGISALWPRSYWRIDQIGVNTSPASPAATMPTGITVTLPPQTGTFWGIATYRGTLYFVRYATYDSVSIPTGWNSYDIYAALAGSYIYDQTSWQKWGFSYDWHDSTSTIAFVGVPLWLLALICFFPLNAIRRRVMNSRNPRTCHVCGYDLRATPHQCPECGTTANKNKDGFAGS